MAAAWQWHCRIKGGDNCQINGHVSDKTVENGLAPTYGNDQGLLAFNNESICVVCLAFIFRVCIHCSAQEDISSGQASTGAAAIKYKLEGTYVKSGKPQEGTHCAANTLHYTFNLNKQCSRTRLLQLTSVTEFHTTHVNRRQPRTWPAHVMVTSHKHRCT